MTKWINCAQWKARNLLAVVCLPHKLTTVSHSTPQNKTFDPSIFNLVPWCRWSYSWEVVFDVCCYYVVAMLLICDCLLRNQTKLKLKNSIKFKDPLRSVRCARLWIFWPRPERKCWSSSCGACSRGGCKASVAKVWWNNCRHERELYAVDAITWGRREENISNCGQNICVGPVKGGWGKE